MIKFLDKKLFRYLSVFLFLNSSILPIKASSALAAWALNTNGVLELRTKSNTNLEAYFQKANQISGDRFWVDFPGELKKALDLLASGKAVNYEGASSVELTDVGEASGAFIEKEIKGGKFKDKKQR